jgi:predicted TIM-barrel fold metal-dependent hydrolase
MLKLLNQRIPFLSAILIAGISCFVIIPSCSEKTAFYSSGDFKKVPKTDVHLHINSLDRRYLELADSYNFRVVSSNVDSRISVDEQLKTAIAIRKAWPDRFAFLGTFSVDSFGTVDFAENTIARIKECISTGASGIKIWKNIGMVLKDKEGKYVMIDDPGFDQVFSYLEKNKIPVMGHLGEPKNCWLPLEAMTDSANARYYRANPQYHMYLHPEAPTYNDQMIARDNLLKKHPNLDFTGAHLASMEWSVEEVAKRMDLFPNLKVDLSARMAHLQYQSISDYERVRNFMIKYQDRILYGTDITINQQDTNFEAKSKTLSDRWRSNWIYLATDSTFRVKDLPGLVKGLHLPKEVIDKIYYKNAEQFFKSNRIN